MGDINKRKEQLVRELSESRRENISLKQKISQLSDDINERKRAGETLREREEWFRNLFEQTTDGIFFFDMDGKIVDVNRSFAEMHGYTQREIMQMNISNLDSAETHQHFTKRIDSLRKGEKLKFEVEHFHKDGHKIPLEVITTMITMGDRDYIMASHRDRTENKRAERAIINAWEKAEESDRLKSAFLANMGHEIRTPMNGIMGFSELLKNKALTGEEQSEYINIIEKSGARMLNIINDLIDISKIESGQMNVHTSKCNINEQIDFIYAFFKPEIETKGLKFRFIKSLTNDEALIRTDKEKVNAILINLIKNAIKFTDCGSIEFGYTKNREFLEFYVKDTGVGISPDHKEIIFERFRQGSEKLSRNYEGAGLGLSISKSFVEMLDGKIWMESAPGTGSVFYFTIPYNQEAKETFSMSPYLGTELRYKNSLKIMIAEDDNISELLLSTMVRNFSRGVLKARNGKEAIDTCRKNPELDLILMDIKMPEIDGYEATRRIREFNKDVIIIAQTSYALSGDRDKAIEAGCNDYISKPILKDELFSLINKHVLTKITT